MGFVSLLLDLGIVVICLLAAIYVYFKWAFTYWKKRNVPYVEPSFPFGNFGKVILSRKNVGDVLIDIYKNLEGHRYGGMFIFQKANIVLRDPDLIKDVLVKNFSTFHDRGEYMNEEIEPLSGHLFTLPGKRWRNLRVKLTPTFTSGKMKMMFQTLLDCGQELQLCLEEKYIKGDVIEIKDILARYSTDVISSCAFGIQCNCLKNEHSEFRQWGEKFFNPSLKMMLLQFLSVSAPIILDTLRLSTIDKNISKYFRKMVQETVDYREKNNIRRNDFMHLLIQLKKNGSLDPDQEAEEHRGETATEETETTDGISMGSLAAQAFVFFLAGFETSSTTMTFCLYELSLNPDIQEIVREEIDTILRKHGGNITYEAILEMEYLDKVVAETLRKYPPIPILTRECSRAYTIPGTDITLEKGVLAIVPVSAFHHDPKYYPDPERFDPERFSEEEKAKRHHFVYLPFGEGPRICIGMRFGLMQTKVGLVSLLSKYQFSVTEKTPIPLVLDVKSFIPTSLGGMWLKIENISIK